MYAPTPETLEKARSKGSFILALQGNYENRVYDKFEAWAGKNGLAFVNVVGIQKNVKLDSFKFMAYWIKMQYADLVTDYAKANPKIRMAIYL